MATVSTSGDAYQDLDAIRERLDYRGRDFFDEQNAQLRFDELLVRLERESRGIFETLWGDETPLSEDGRTDTLRTTDDAAIPLVYPIRDVTKVEYKTSIASDWETLDADRYDATDHRLVLAARPNLNALRGRRRHNVIAGIATRASWRDLGAKLRVTYDRGFSGGAPDDVVNIQNQMIQNALRHRKREQTVSSASPEELADATATPEMLTDDLRDRIADVTTPGKATLSI